MLKEETIMLGCAIVITGAAVVMISNANTVREETELLSSKIHGLNSDVRLATDHLVQLRAETKEGNRILNSLLDAEIKKKASIDAMSGTQPSKIKNLQKEDKKKPLQSTDLDRDRTRPMRRAPDEREQERDYSRER